MKTKMWISAALMALAAASSACEVVVGGARPTVVDRDGDGLLANVEARLGLSDLDPDFDGDGLYDGEEVNDFFTSPFDQDTDGDGLWDGEEALVYYTDPLNWDSDGDDLSDGDEVFVYGTDPLLFDTDGNGWSDGDEALFGPR